MLPLRYRPRGFPIECSLSASNRLDVDSRVPHRRGIRSQCNVARRHMIALQEIRDDIDILVVAQTAWFVLRHRVREQRVQIEHATFIPPDLERLAVQLTGWMTPRTRRLIHLLAAHSLLVRVR